MRNLMKTVRDGNHVKSRRPVRHEHRRSPFFMQIIHTSVADDALPRIKPDVGGNNNSR